MDHQRLARAQYGLLTRSQVLTEITSDALRWRLRRQGWRVVHPGVYATHAQPLDWLARASAALLYCGPGAALALNAAAHLLGIEPKPPPVLAVAIPATTKRQKCPGFTVRRRRRLVTTMRKRLRVTAAAFTVLDMGDVATASREDAIAIVARAVQRRVTTVAELAQELRQRRTHQHRRALDLSLGVVAEGAESVLEVEFVTKVLAAHGLPAMRMAVPDRGAGGAIRRDFVDETHGLVIELDGRAAHEGQRGRDLRRDRHSAARGWQTLRAEWVDVHFEPCQLAAEVFATLRRRGYRGVLRPCGPACSALRHMQRGA